MSRQTSTPTRTGPVLIDPRADRIAAIKAELADLETGVSKSARYDKAFRVEVTGSHGKAREIAPAVVERCCDESEAKRLYFARAGITDTHHYNVKVTQVASIAPPAEGTATDAPSPAEAVTFEPTEPAKAESKPSGKDAKKG